MSMQVIDEDQYTPEVIYGTGSHTFTREKIGTRYVTLGVRILVDPADPEDIRHYRSWAKQPGRRLRLNGTRHESRGHGMAALDCQRFSALG
jgi:hypothetical protein